MNSAYVVTVFMAPPAWVLAKVRELVAEGDAPELIVEHLYDLGFTCTVR